MRRREQDLSTPPGGDRDTERDPQFITALARGLEVLRQFRRGDGALGNQELARRCGLPKPTISRITYTLSRLGYLAYLPEAGKYRLSVGALSLGLSALGQMGIRDVARPFMQALADETGLSVALGARDRLTMVYVECCVGQQPFRLDLEVGSHLRLATSAIGRACLAAMPAHERGPIEAQLALREGEGWPAAKAGIEQAVIDLAGRGFVVSDGDWQPQVSAAAVPLDFGGGSLGLALNCGGPSVLLAPGVLEATIGPKLVATARRILAAVDRA